MTKANPARASEIFQCFPMFTPSSFSSGTPSLPSSSIVSTPETRLNQELRQIASIRHSYVSFLGIPGAAGWIQLPRLF